MAELLLELFSEEIPARMQAKAEADLLAALTQRLKEAGLNWKNAFAVSGPRRLTAVVEGLDARSADVREEKKGPKVGAPEQAIAGFLRGAGLKDISEAEIVSDPKKGDSYVAWLSKPGRDATDVIAESVPEIIKSFHWPKSMRTADGDLRWVRPLQGIVCVFDDAVVPFEVGGVASGNSTEGHRVHGRGPYTVKGWKDYEAQLSKAGHVVLSRDARREVILGGIARVCKDAGLEWIEDKGLLEEVVGLAEWPVVILGQMDPDFLDLPPEVITLSMRTHQKYFAANDTKTGKLAPNFIVVANIAASDGGVKIAEGNARVLSARLSDARFFWDVDCKVRLESRLEKLSNVVFHRLLGTVAGKSERVEGRAGQIMLGRDDQAGAVNAKRAARLAKCDLASEMVSEFPELEGVMGRYYAQQQEEDTSVADAIRDHYKPKGPSDEVPSAPVSVAVALADKLDTLVGFWAINEKPTGSKDPFALRRAALGWIRLVLENQWRLKLREEILAHLDSLAPLDENGNRWVWGYDPDGDASKKNPNLVDSPQTLVKDATALTEDLLSFFADRLKQVLRDQGKRHDLTDAVFALNEDDLVLIVKRVEALGAFLETEDGATLLAGYKRAANILKAEEKKGAMPENLSVDAKLIARGPEVEQALWAALQKATRALEAPLKAEDFAGAMTVLSGLRGPVDAFFEGVMVNDSDAAVRANRLALLVAVREALHQVADFSRIEG
ncbi:MAG: glycine--tRNA ligase subunit beta [Hyphomonas sp.]